MEKEKRKEILGSVIELIFEDYEKQISDLKMERMRLMAELEKAKDLILDDKPIKIKVNPIKKKQCRPGKPKSESSLKIDEYIQENYNRLTAKQLSKELSISIKAVQKRVTALGITKPYKLNPLARESMVIPSHTEETMYR